MISAVSQTLHHLRWETARKDQDLDEELPEELRLMEEKMAG